MKHPLVDVMRVGPSGDTGAVEVSYPAQTKTVVVYCDGSCLGNPGPGGWAALIRVEGERERLISGSESHTTNNRMEIQAALEALLTLPAGSRVQVITDSNYVVKGMSEWRHNWVKKGWLGAGGKPVENRELWLALIAAATPHSLTWSWVKGHSGHPENERVDEASREAAKRLLAPTIKGKENRNKAKKSPKYRDGFFTTDIAAALDILPAEIFRLAKEAGFAPIKEGTNQSGNHWRLWSKNQFDHFKSMIEKSKNSTHTKPE